MGRLLLSKSELSISLAPALALSAVATLSLGTVESWGFYTEWGFAAVMWALLIGAVACVAYAKTRSEISSNSLIGLSLMTVGIGCWMAYVAYHRAHLYYLEDSDYAQNMMCVNYWGAFGVGFLFVVATAWNWIDRGRWQATRCVFLFTIMFAVALTERYFAIVATPDPVIDVFNLLRDDADHIVAGRNPYSNDIVSPYGTPRAEEYGLTEPADPRPAGYPPLPYLLSVPPRLFGADVRWSNVVGDLLAASAIAIAGFRRGRPMLALFITAIYLNLPRMPWIIEQAWYEPMIAGLLGIGLVLSEFGGPTNWCGYALIGLGLTAKQFGLPLLLPLAWAHRRNWRKILVGLMIGGLVILPWFVWSPRDFVDTIIWKHLARPLQPQSITVGSYLLNEFDISMPRVLGWVLAGVSLTAISAVTPKNGAATALGLGAALLAFCVFHTQGFPNYFYLVNYLWLLGFVGVLPAKQSDARMSHGGTNDVQIRPIS